MSALDTVNHLITIKNIFKEADHLSAPITCAIELTKNGKEIKATKGLRDAELMLYIKPAIYDPEIQKLILKKAEEIVMSELEKVKQKLETLEDLK